MASLNNTDLDEEIICNINITPLVDVVLVLLVIFLITAPSLYQSSIPIELPKAKTGESATQQLEKPLIFTLNSDGKLFLEYAEKQESISWNQLKSHLMRFKKSLIQTTAIIRADQKTPHGTVIQLIDTLRENGLNHFALDVNSNTETVQKSF